MDRLAEKLSKEDYNLVEELQDQASIAQCEENECHFKIGFSAGLLVQQEAVEQMKEMGTTGGAARYTTFGPVNNWQGA